MKKLILLFLSITLIILSSNTAQGQINLNKLKNKVSNAVNDAVSQKVNEAMLRASERIYEKYWNDIASEYYGNYPYMAGIPIQNPDATIEKQYVFTQYIELEFKAYNKKGKLTSTSYLSTLSTKDGSFGGTTYKSEEGETIIISDFENRALVMLYDKNGEKSRVIFVYTEADKEEVVIEKKEYKEVAKNQASTPETVGYESKDLGTKMIRGFKCNGTAIITEDTYGEVWVIENGRDERPDGTCMQIITIDEETKEKVIIETAAWEQNAKFTYLMSDYPIALP